MVRKSFGFLRLFFTIMILGFVVFFGLGNAVKLDIGTNTNEVFFGELLKFNLNVDIEKNERLPIDKIRFKIYDEYGTNLSVCEFDVYGNIVGVCDVEFENVSLVYPNFNYGYGFLNGDGSGYNSTNNTIREENFLFGYGYGYGYGYDYNSFSDLFSYEVFWRVPFFNETFMNYKAVFEVYSNNSDRDFTYVADEFIITAFNKRPVALTDRKEYIGDDTNEIVVNASLSYDINEYEIEKYYVYDDDELVLVSNESILDFLLPEGVYNYSLIVENEIGIMSLPYNFSIIVKSDFNNENLYLVVNELIGDDSLIRFEVVQKEFVGNRDVKLKPQIYCMDIPFDLIFNENGSYISSGISFKKDVVKYNFTISRLDLDLNLPYGVECEFNLFLEDKNVGSQIVLVDGVVFESEIFNLEAVESFYDEQRLVNYIYKSFSKKFGRGYNQIRYEFVNDGIYDVNMDLIVTAPELGLEYTDSLSIKNDGSSYISFIPFFIGDNVDVGKYPVRISYRLNDEELKTKYGFIEVFE